MISVVARLKSVWGTMQYDLKAADQRNVNAQLNLGILYSLKKVQSWWLHTMVKLLSGTERRLFKAMQIHSKGTANLATGLGPGRRCLPRVVHARTRPSSCAVHHAFFPALAPQFPDVLTLTSGEVVAAALPSAVYALRALTRIDSAEVAIGLIRACLQRD
jgi:hypothetical protein